MEILQIRSQHIDTRIVTWENRTPCTTFIYVDNDKNCLEELWEAVQNISYGMKDA